MLELLGCIYCISGADGASAWSIAQEYKLGAQLYPCTASDKSTMYIIRSVGHLDCSHRMENLYQIILILASALSFPATAASLFLPRPSLSFRPHFVRLVFSNKNASIR